MSAAEQPSPSRDTASWAALVVVMTAVAAAEARSPLPLAVAGFAKLALACVALGAAALFYGRVRVNARLSASCIALMQALLFSAGGSILSYLLARSGGALWDPTLHRWDASLGLDWLSYVRLVDAHAWVALFFKLAYASLIPQIILVILALGFGGRLDELRTFVFAAIVSGIAAIAASPLFPAVGNFAYLNLAHDDFAHVWQWSNLDDVRDFLAVRSGRMAILDLRTMQGIIVFPSYHGALATLSLWAFWKSRLGWIRWAGGAVALTTLAATPVDGGHYFVDVIAGTAVALFSIAAGRRLVCARTPLPRRFIPLPSRRSREAFAP